MVVERIFISPQRSAPQSERERITIEAGLGVLGDRNFGKNIYPGQNITLIEAEEIELFCAEHFRVPDLSLMRRNLVTRGIRLNDLVNAEFTVGDVRLRGIELCEPCTIVGNILSNASLSPRAAIKYWVRRGGLRADVVSSGEIVRGASLNLAVAGSS